MGRGSGARAGGYLRGWIGGCLRLLGALPRAHSSEVRRGGNFDFGVGEKSVTRPRSGESQFDLHASKCRWLLVATKRWLASSSRRADVSAGRPLRGALLSCACPRQPYTTPALHQAAADCLLSLSPCVSPPHLHLLSRESLVCGTQMRFRRVCALLALAFRYMYFKGLLEGHAEKPSPWSACGMALWLELGFRPL